MPRFVYLNTNMILLFLIVVTKENSLVKSMIVPLKANCVFSVSQPQVPLGLLGFYKYRVK